MLKRVLTSVDLPRPDSPETRGLPGQLGPHEDVTTVLTDDHSSELEAFPNALPVYLVGQVGKSDVAIELFANDRCRPGLCRLLGERRARAVHPARAVGSERLAIGGRNVRVGHRKNQGLKADEKEE